MARVNRVARLSCLLLLVMVGACNDQVTPTAVEVDVEEPGEEVDVPTQLFEENAIFSDRAHPFEVDAFELRSSPEEVTAGSYRFASIDEPLPDVGRDDYIVTPGPDGDMAVYLVLESAREGNELRLETAPAYWHDIIRGGTYNVTIPFDGSDDVAFETPGPAGAPINLSSGQRGMPAAELELDGTNVCQLVEDITGQTICGEPVDKEIGAGVTVRVAGTLDSLAILTGNVRVTGDMALAVTIESGGVEGGTRPTFAPCNRRFYRGCLVTPTGALLVEFLRRWGLPADALAPNRVCLPGTPIQVRRGYWSGFQYTPPRYELCRITNLDDVWNDRPRVVLPHVLSIENTTTPRIDGHIVMRVKGDGEFGLKVQLPVVGWQAAYDIADDLKVKASLGLFVDATASLLNAGATVRFDFDDTGRVTQTWTNTSGWEGDFELLEKSNNVDLLRLDSPDSVVVRVGVPLEANFEACIALTKCEEADDDSSDDSSDDDGAGSFLLDGLAIGVEAGATVTMFNEAVWTREQVHPTDPDIDNWHISIDAAYDLNLKAGITIPLTGWIAPDVPRAFDETWECCRLRMNELWGQGSLEVTTATTGTDLDPDGYSVLVQQASDGVPEIIDEGTSRVGPGWPTRIFDRSIDPDDSARFGLGFVPCLVYYSDALLASNPVYGLAAGAARKVGIDIPTKAITSPCRWLIAPYTVTLSGVAANCTVEGGAVRENVWLEQTRINPPRVGPTELQFDVVCSAVGPEGQGSIQVTLDPGFSDADAPPYVLLDGQPAGVFETTDTLVITGLEPGTYSVEVLGIDPFCTAAVITANVVANILTEVSVTPNCDFPAPPVGSVTFQATTTGDMLDGNAYLVTRDDAVVAALPLNGQGMAEGLEAGVPTAFWISDIAGNCQAEGSNPRVVTLDGALTPVEIPFPIRCFAERPDTLVGTLDASGWPVSTVTIRAEDGTTLMVSGPKKDELARFTGTAVTLWGQASATGINVNGYDLRSPLGDDRWLGILLDRPDGTWLFTNDAEESMRLIDPPAGLVAESGNLVWLMGAEVDGGVVPTLYGVVRGGGS